MNLSATDRNQVCDLDSIMEFSQNRSQTSSRAGSLAGLQPASELDSVMEFGLKQMQQPENIISSMLKIV